MSDTTTANYAWVKPEVGASADTWGTKNNVTLDSQDATVKAVSDVANAALPKAGGTMTGAILGTQFSGTSGMGVQGVSVGSGATTTIYNVPASSSDGVYLVFATFGTGQGIVGVFAVSGGVPGTIARLTDTAVPTGAISLSVSGQAIRMTNNTVGSQSMSGAVTRLGGAQ